MSSTRPFVLSIAGTDPSGGAGVFADLKTLEAHRVHGLGVVSALTCQSDTDFFGVDWIPAAQIVAQAEAVLHRFPVAVTKIGLVENLETLQTVITFLRQVQPDMKIIWDPILQASSGYVFHGEQNQQALETLLPQLFLVTPNIPEVRQLAPAPQPVDSARLLSRYCHVLLKGGHAEEKPGLDLLIQTTGKLVAFRPRPALVSPKHGSGCVFAAALAANLARGNTLPRAVRCAKHYTSRFLSSNPSLLGFHS